MTGHAPTSDVPRVRAQAAVPPGRTAESLGAGDPPKAQAANVIQAQQKEAKDRKESTALDLVGEIWDDLGLPRDALSSLSLDMKDGPSLPSCYKIGHLAQASIALSALTCALVHSSRNHCNVPKVTVPIHHAVVDFKSERLYTIDGKPSPSAWGPIGGLHKTSDGFIRIHDSLPNHRHGALQLLDLPVDATREQVADKVKQWASIDLETVGLQRGLAMYALRTEAQWDLLPQSRAISDHPIQLREVKDSPPGLPPHFTPGNDRCLRGLRVVDMSRVIAGPLAGKTLAAHGADVIWVTSPDLPDLPALDREFGRGKRTVHLNLHKCDDRHRLVELLRSCDVFIQSYRPGSLAAHGLSPQDVAAINPRIIYADLSAWGSKGPWSGRRGFDSLVQTSTGMNVTEATQFGAGEVARVMPTQALDHGAGYLLAAGITAALYRRSIQGASWHVEVSLAGVMKFLRSLGQYPGRSGFQCKDVTSAEDCEDDLFCEADSGFGRMRFVKHAAKIEGCDPGWDVMPKPLGSDQPEWLDSLGP